jgi:hypothetical protein
MMQAVSQSGFPLRHPEHGAPLRTELGAALERHPDPGEDQEDAEGVEVVDAERLLDQVAGEELPCSSFFIIKYPE